MARRSCWRTRRSDCRWWPQTLSGSPGRAILAALIAGQRDPAVLAELARKTATTQANCVSLRPDYGFYEAAHVGTKQLTTPVSRCTTISVSDIRDPSNPQGRCKRFSVGFWPLVNGSLTYTKPVDACGASRTVLARDVPDHTRYIVLYESGPGMPHVDSRCGTSVGVGTNTFRRVPFRLVRY